MSVSLLEVIGHGGFNPLGNPDDAIWLLSKQQEFEDLIDKAEDFLEEIDQLRQIASDTEDTA